MADQSNGYTLGFADGRRSMFHEIVTTVAEERHEPECRCEPCQVMRVVLEQYLGTMQEMLGDEKYRQMTNDLAVASDQEPRPFRG